MLRLHFQLDHDDGNIVSGDKEEEHVDVDSAVADSAVPEPETERKADTPDLIKTDNAKCRLFEEVEPANDEDGKSKSAVIILIS